MTERQKFVIELLSSRPTDWFGPTEIAQKFSYKVGGRKLISSHFTHTLKQLVKEGYIERSNNGMYKIK